MVGRLGAVRFLVCVCFCDRSKRTCEEHRGNQIFEGGRRGREKSDQQSEVATDDGDAVGAGYRAYFLLFWFVGQRERPVSGRVSVEVRDVARLTL